MAFMRDAGRNEGHRGVTLQGRRVSPPRAGMPRNGAQRVDRTRASPLNRHGQCRQRLAAPISACQADSHSRVQKQQQIQPDDDKKE
jgi:hypothetical protein